MKQEEIHEYLHTLTTLHLAIQFDNSSKYLKAVAKRIATKHRPAKLLCLGIMKAKLPRKTIRQLVRQMQDTYARQGYDWTEQ